MTNLRPGIRPLGAWPLEAPISEVVAAAPDLTTSGNGSSGPLSKLSGGVPVVPVVAGVAIAGRRKSDLVGPRPWQLAMGLARRGASRPG